MKKMYAFVCLVSIACLVVIASTSISTTSASNTTDANGLLLEAPTTFDFNLSKEVPAGYDRVSYRPKTEEKAKTLWLQANNGSLEGFTFEKAKQITSFARKGTAPCACHMSGACYPYDFVNKICLDECGGKICNPGSACKTTEELNKANNAFGE